MRMKINGTMKVKTLKILKIKKLPFLKAFFTRKKNFTVLSIENDNFQKQKISN